MRVLAVDPGEKNLGIAISDPTGTIATPLTVLKHVSRQADAAAIVQMARDREAGQIVIGAALDEDGQLTPEGRRANRLAGAVRRLTDLKVVLWDESGSTQAARAARIAAGARRSKRRGHLDQVAAAVILQDYLDAQGSQGLATRD